jgi:hypothetical protein
MTQHLDINDGYTERTSIDGVQFSWRPIQEERRVRILRSVRRAVSPSDAIVSILRRLAYFSHETPLNTEQQLEAFWKVVGASATEQQIADETNLRTGVWLELQYPHIAKRPCEQCKIWWYDHNKGTIVRSQGKRQKRPQRTPLPCETSIGCVKGTPEKSRALSPKNKLAYRHYLMCKATGSFPQDDTVVKNAMIIAGVEQRAMVNTLCAAVKESVHARV